jgi:kynurenine formamidase
LIDVARSYWPTSPSRFKKKQLAYGETEAGWFYSANSICTPEHGGTHLDAPLHFAAGGLGADELPLENLIAAGVVIDVSDHTASIDYGPSVDFPVHRIAAAKNIGGLENFDDLDKLPPTGFIVLALPMKIEGGSGGPVRVVALVPK